MISYFAKVSLSLLALLPAPVDSRRLISISMCFNLILTCGKTVAPEVGAYSVLLVWCLNSSMGSHQQEVYFPDDGVLQVILGFVILKFYVQAVLYANLHLQRNCYMNSTSTASCLQMLALIAAYLYGRLVCKVWRWLIIPDPKREVFCDAGPIASRNGHSQ